MNKVLLLHLPKTSGTTIKFFLKDMFDSFFVQANSIEQLGQNDPLLGKVQDLEDIKRILGTHDGLALHVDAEFNATSTATEFRSLAWHLFEPTNSAYFKQFNILMMLRHPFRRFLSEYQQVCKLVHNNPDFLPELDVSSLEAFLDHQHSNATLHFLLASCELAERRTLTRDDLERVKACIRDCPIHVCIFERYAESINYFSQVIGRQFSVADLPRLNVGKTAYEAGAGVESKFWGKNMLDKELYDFATRLFDQRSRSFSAAPASILEL